MENKNTISFPSGCLGRRRLSRLDGKDDREIVKKVRIGHYDLNCKRTSHWIISNISARVQVCIEGGNRFDEEDAHV